MKINYLAIILLVFSCKPVYAAGFNSYSWLRASLESSLQQPCLLTNNLAINELILANLGVSHSNLLLMPLAEKERLMDQFRSKYCINRSTASNPSPRYDVYKDQLSNLLSFLPSLYSVLSDRNLTAIEYVLNCFGVPYDSLINLDLSSKISFLSGLFVPNLTSGLTSPAKSVSVPVSVVLPVPAAGGAGAPVVAPVVIGLNDYSNVVRRYGAQDIRYTSVVGMDWDVSELAKPKNSVGKNEYPDLNKYNQGYGVFNLIVLQNDYRKFKRFVPDLIKTNLLNIDDAKIDLFVEIAAGKDFYEKARQYNMIFHGALTDWYKTEMDQAGFVFDRNGFARDLLMGIFNYDGIQDHGADIARNSLSAKNVNVHNGLYSPDNAGFIIKDGRHLVTFWSVAKSNDKLRAVVTFHILFDRDLQGEDFRNYIIDKCNDRSIDTLGKLLTRLKEASLKYLAASEDKNAYDSAVSFLCDIYGVRLA